MPNHELYILVDRRNSRMQYLASELFDRRLGLKAHVVASVADVPEAALVLNYSSQKHESWPAIQPSKILFEKRIQTQDLEMQDGPLPKLFALKHHDLGFDPLAAVFYLLTRYEEYLPHRSDVHGRFSMQQHFMVIRGAHQKPLVELYSNALFDWLHDYYPQLERKQVDFSPIVTVDIDQLFSVKAKGLVRSALGAAKDFVQGRLLERAAVLLGRTKDPNDIYDRILTECSGAEISPICFVQVGENSRFDLNNPPHLYAVRQRINEIGLGAEVGVHPSYYSSESNEILNSEVERLREISNGPVVRSRQHYLRFRLPQTFRILSDLGIQEEYSMGFYDLNGFRAGTCMPFKLYDLEREEVVHITMVPMAWMDLVAQRNHASAADAFRELKGLVDAVKEVGGVLVTTWHPEVLNGQVGDDPIWSIFERFLAYVKD